MYTFCKTALFFLLYASFGSVNAQITPTESNVRVVEVFNRLVPPSQGSSVLLNIAGWYVLYTNPVAPYQNQRGVIMVPLRVVGTLLGGSVSYNASQKLGKISRMGHEVEFEADSNTARTDDKQIKLTSSPYWLANSGELIVPLEAITQVFDIDMHYNRKTRMVSLNGSHFAKELALSENQWLPGGYQDTQKLLPDNVLIREVKTRFRGETLTSVKAKPKQIEIKLALREVTEKGVPAGKQGLFTLVNYAGEGGVSYGGRSAIPGMSGGPSADPCKKTEDSYVCTQFYAPGKRDSLNGKAFPIDSIAVRVRMKE